MLNSFPCHWALPPPTRAKPSVVESVSLLFKEPSLCNHCTVYPSSYRQVDAPRHTRFLDPHLLSAHVPTSFPLGYSIQY